MLTKLIDEEYYRTHMFQSYIGVNQEFANSIHRKTTIYDSLKPNSAKTDIDLITREILGLGLD
jgi:hypothetical protein